MTTQEIFEARGYIVIATDDTYAPGHVLPTGWGTLANREHQGSPLLVVCETDQADYLAQRVDNYEMALLRYGFIPWAHYYRVIAE